MSDPEKPVPDPFSQLAGYQQVLIPIAIQLSQEGPTADGDYGTASIDSSEKIRLEIRSLTSTELEQADRLLDAAKAPAVFVEEPAKVGSKQIHTGYDFEDPEYLAARDRASRNREAYICLFGCPSLYESAPGNNIAEKAKALRDRIPDVAIRLLCQNIEAIGVSGVVGQEEVDRFFTEGSKRENGTSSKSSSTRSRAKKKGKS